MAREMGESKGFLNLDQYSNHANVAAHAKWTARQVWEQTAGELTVFCTGLGTTGTALGAVEYFKQQQAPVKVVGVYCLPNNAVPGVRSMDGLAEISFDWRSEIPEPVGVATKESFRRVWIFAVRDWWPVRVPALLMRVCFVFWENSAI